VEARSMIGGAIAFCAYACCVSYVLMRYRVKASVAASLLLVWLGLSTSLWLLWWR
jgi:RsiW-degrading membrane proteinase PrsW (M82 family)